MKPTGFGIGDIKMQGPLMLTCWQLKKDNKLESRETWMQYDAFNN